MKCVLINPPVHDFAAFDLWMKPFGLLLIADFLRRNGVEASLIDATDPFHAYLDGLPTPRRKIYGTERFYAEEIPKPAIFKGIPRKYRRRGLPPDRLESAMASCGPTDVVMVSCSRTSCI